MRQHAEPGTRGERLAHRAAAVDERIAAIGSEHGVEHSQRRRLARAVGAQEPGDASIGGAQGDLAHRRHRAEMLRELLRLDHGAGPLSEVKNGSGRAARTQLTSSASTDARATNCAMTRSTQGAVSWP